MMYGAKMQLNLESAQTIDGEYDTDVLRARFERTHAYLFACQVTV